MKPFLLYIFGFFVILGVKYAYADTAVLIPLLLIPFLISKRSDARILYWGFYICISISLLMILLLCSQVMNGDIFIEDNFRLIRAVLTMVLIILAFENKTAEFIFKTIFYILFAHCIIVILAANNNFLNELMSIISGNIKIRPGRASGLVAGFDIAGTLSLFAFGMIVTELIPLKPIFRLLFSMTLITSVFYTSRVSMAIALCITILWIVTTICSNKFSLTYKIFFMASLIIPTVVVLRRFISIIDITFNLGLNSLNSDDIEAIRSLHTVQSDDSFLWEDMFFLPNTFYRCFFGAGANVATSDIGYVKEIFRYGVLGLFISVAIHYLVLVNPLRLLRNSLQKNNLIIFSYFIFILVILLNFKNNYFFTRGVWPIYIMYGLATYKMAEQGQINIIDKKTHD